MLNLYCTPLLTILFWITLFRIYVVHDEVKDKNFELELSWIGKGQCRLLLVWTTLRDSMLIEWDSLGGGDSCPAKRGWLKNILGF